MPEDFILILFLSLAFFSAGLYGILTSRGGIRLIISVEILINSANLNIVAYALSNVQSAAQGVFFVLLSIVIAAAESAVGFAILVALYRVTKGVELSSLKDLRW